MDRSFTGLSVLSVAFLGLALIVVLAPIIVRGAGAFVFRGTVEHRRMILEKFERGDREQVLEEVERADAARRPVYQAVESFQQWLDESQHTLRDIEKRLGDFEERIRSDREMRREFRKPLRGLKNLLGFYTDERLDEWTIQQELDYPEYELPPTDELNELVLAELARRRSTFAGTSLDPLFEFVRSRSDTLLRPRRYERDFAEFNKNLRELLGPAPSVPTPVLVREQYGATRWDRAMVKLERVLRKTEFVYPEDGAAMGAEVKTPRAEAFEGTPLEQVFPLFEDQETVEEMLRPRLAFYWRFLTDDSIDAHMFGGIWPEMLGTIYLTLGAIAFAVPMGLLCAIYLVEYAGDNLAVSILRTFVSTLAGVPSIVFGLFGLAFFINSVGVSESKSVLAGAMTLGLLVLPMVIRASEEALKAVPNTYKEASYSLGANRWRTILTVILPSALPGVLTGIVISMGRAAGETAPIIFTAAVSVGKPLKLWEVFTQPTPALPWNIYNIATEHQAVEEIRHVQYGMVFVLVSLVLLLNLAAIVLRARISKKLKG